MGKPRMTQRDRWKKRPCVEKYYALKDEINAQKKDFEMPESNARIVFFIPMPKSWSKKSKKQMLNKPHKQRPDIDNFLKMFFDCLCKEDNYIWDVRATKIWSDAGQIDVYVDKKGAIS